MGKTTSAVSPCCSSMEEEEEPRPSYKQQQGRRLKNEYEYTYEGDTFVDRAYHRAAASGESARDMPLLTTLHVRVL